MVDIRALDPSMCKCREKGIAHLMSEWSQRVLGRIKKAIEDGRPINLKRLQHEAQLTASIARGGKSAFAAHNVEFGHLCDECPYRLKNPAKKADLGIGEIKARTPPPPEEFQSVDD